MFLKQFRRLAVLVLALLLPLQGLAAVSAGICMSMGHHDAGAAMHHGDGHAHGGDHAHGAHESTPAHDEDSGDTHCAPCVACCAAAAIAPASALISPQQLPAVAIAATPSPAPGGLPNALDRPPLPL